jgi:hypothetical protein
VFFLTTDENGAPIIINSDAITVLRRTGSDTLRIEFGKDHFILLRGPSALAVWARFGVSLSQTPEELASAQQRFASGVERMNPPG